MDPSYTFIFIEKKQHKRQFKKKKVECDPEKEGYFTSTANDSCDSGDTERQAITKTVLYLFRQ